MLAIYVDFYGWLNLLWAPIAAVLLVFLIVRLTVDIIKFRPVPSRPDFFRRIYDEERRNGA